MSLAVFSVQRAMLVKAVNKSALIFFTCFPSFDQALKPHGYDITFVMCDVKLCAAFPGQAACQVCFGSRRRVSAALDQPEGTLGSGPPSLRSPAVPAAQQTSPLLQSGAAGCSDSDLPATPDP